MMKSIYAAWSLASLLLVHLPHAASSGGWSEWKTVGDCSDNCVGSKILKYRTCDNPITVNDGNLCEDSQGEFAYTESIEQLCPLDATCNVAGNRYCTPWSPVSDCSRECGGGEISSYRSCGHLLPVSGGEDADGTLSVQEKKEPCNVQECHVDGAWSDWDMLGYTCSKPCGGGTINKSRTCTNPEPSGTGALCENSDGEESLFETKYNEDCNISPCLASSGGWSEWKTVGDCSDNCVGSKILKYRTCDNPITENGGDLCKDSQEEFAYTESIEQLCPLDATCNVEGNRYCAPWSPVSECSRECGGGKVSSYRSCGHLLPVSGGEDADGTLSVQEKIEPCNVQECDVDGNWSGWDVLGGICSKSCGGGTITKSRSCTNPEPSGTGALCDDKKGEESFFETFDEVCNDIACFVDSEENWTNWTLCDNCTVGIKYRLNLCGGKVCEGGQLKNDTDECNRWSLDCPDPCDEPIKVKCMEFAVCKNISTAEMPLTECVCTMGKKMNAKGTACQQPPPTPPTPRPIPTLPPEEKQVAGVITKSASVILIVFVTITLVLFIILRVFTTDRVIQMNMEIALLMAHVFLMFPAEITSNQPLCKFVSIAIHFFFTAVYIFIALDAIHMYCFVAHVVKKGGYFTRLQNIGIGWGSTFIIVLMCICFQYDNYGASYHCWLQVDTPLVYGHIVPAIFFTIVTFTFIEAAGMVDDYEPLPGIDQEELMSAKVSQRTNLIILPLVVVHWIIGIYSEYEQDLALYSIFAVLNGVLGACVFFLHCTNNAKVRDKVYGFFKTCCGTK